MEHDWQPTGAIDRGKGRAQDIPYYEVYCAGCKISRYTPVKPYEGMSLPGDLRCAPPSTESVNYQDYDLPV